MRSLGLVGGMSWHSTALYYGRLNRAVEAALGTHHSFKGQIANLDYAELLASAIEGRWPDVEQSIVAAARQLAASGCEVVALTAVTAHRFHASVVREAGVEVPHVLDGAASHLDATNVTRAGVLGTQTTCNSTFVEERLGPGRSLMMLDESEQRAIDALIQDVLTADGDLAPAATTLSVAIDLLAARGAETVVLACTELPLLLPHVRSSIPLVDAVALHVDRLCKFIIE
jgi:aspartate racemase